MDAEGAGAEGVAVPIPKTYSRNGRWTVYSSCNPQKKRDPDRVLSKKAQAKREKEHELGTKVGRSSPASFALPPSRDGVFYAHSCRLSCNNWSERPSSV